MQLGAKVEEFLRRSVRRDRPLRSTRPEIAPHARESTLAWRRCRTRAGRNESRCSKNPRGWVYVKRHRFSAKKVTLRCQDRTGNQGYGAAFGPEVVAEGTAGLGCRRGPRRHGHRLWPLRTGLETYCPAETRATSRSVTPRRLRRLPRRFWTPPNPPCAGGGS